MGGVKQGITMIKGCVPNRLRGIVFQANILAKGCLVEAYGRICQLVICCRHSCHSLAELITLRLRDGSHSN